MTGDGEAIILTRDDLERIARAMQRECRDKMQAVRDYDGPADPWAAQLQQSAADAGKLADAIGSVLPPPGEPYDEHAQWDLSPRVRTEAAL